MTEDLQLNQLWPTLYGHSFMSPFEVSEDFTQDCWQAGEALVHSPGDRYYSLQLGSEEVVRMLVVDERGPVDSSYRTPEPIEGAVEIDFIETALGHRHGRLATEAIKLLRNHYPGRVFVAFPGGQYGFWESLGWHRRESDLPGRPVLYVSR